MSSNAGPPPIGTSAVVEREQRASPQMSTYLAVAEALKADRGAEAKAIQAMFGGDKDLMNRFLAVAFSSIAADSELLRKATPMSIVQAIKDAAEMGLEPNGQEGALVVYGDKATFLPMYRGHLKRIRNSGKVTDIDCQLVYVNDEFEYGWSEKGGWFRHTPARPYKDAETGEYVNDRGDYWGTYSYAVMPSGFVELEVLTFEDIEAVRKRFGNTQSRGGKPLPWETSWGEMARKTGLKRLEKRLPGAAVDLLIAAEAKAERAADELVATVSKVDKGLTEVREIALRAVGLLPEGDKAEDQSADGTEAEQPADAEETEAPGGTVESAQPVVLHKGETIVPSEPKPCGAVSPYDATDVCQLPAGHDKNHRGADRSSWA
jgi:phage RecT family recombinase